MKLLALLALLACGCQAPAVEEAEDWTNFYEHQPTSILVLPVLNETSAAEAPIAFSSTITHPLVERGYYVFPVQPTLAILEANGIFEGGQLEAVEPQKFHEILGADALLWVNLSYWEPDDPMIFNWTGALSMSCRLIDARTGSLIWKAAVNNVQDLSKRLEGNALARVLALYQESLVDAVSSEYEVQARHANAVALAELPPGPLRKDYASVREELLARSKPASPRLGP